MKCPLRLRAQKRPLGEATFGVPEFIDDFDLCIEETCAWYDIDKKCCVILHLSNIKESLTLLTADKKQ
ncbi:MAG: hypothetical protein NC824_04835 [Candidatus Omnitrophica bacterium]|nr:hypothetical protein [Candidatus Omnitrophota bacterium]